MKQYLDCLQTILGEGELSDNRTGIPAYVYPHLIIRHDMADGFPLLTTKKMAWKSVKVELEFFIKGLTDKKWLQKRGCHIWDEWCNPQKVPEGLDSNKRKTFQLQELDLGKVYGYQWRNFNSQGEDQLAWILSELKTNPDNRQLVCSAWNPCERHEQALPPCHVLWHVFRSGNRLHLAWFQRSCDFFLGVPFNCASYALLLHLLCKETGYEEGILTGFFSNAHIYKNHLEKVSIQLDRTPFSLPTIRTEQFTSIQDWSFSDTILEDYQCYPKIPATIAV